MSGGREPVGLLGGTFDPVHLGHLHVADRVREALGLRRVLLVLSATPPHKVEHPVGSPDHRMEMLRLAVADRPGLETCTLEIDRGGISYTIDTLRQLRERSPEIVPVFIIGMDSLPELPTWREYRSLVAEFDLVVVDRPGTDLPSVCAGLEPYLAERVLKPERMPAGSEPPGTGGRILHVTIPEVGISSTAIRRRAAGGRPLDGLVPPSVARYILRHRLYLDR